MSKAFHDLPDSSLHIKESEVCPVKASIQSLHSCERSKTQKISSTQASSKSANSISSDPQSARFSRFLGRRSTHKKLVDNDPVYPPLRRFTVNPEKKVPIELASPSKKLSLHGDILFQNMDKVITSEDHFTCPICYNDYEEDNLIKPLDCQHAFCSKCVTAYLIREIDEFHVLKIKCPQDKCEALFQDKHIQETLNKDAYEIYLNKKFLKIRFQDPSLRYCPKPGCTKPFYPDSNHKTTKCTCGTVICHECFNPIHEGKTCSEANEGEYQLFMGDTTIRKCFICKTVIDRYVGCAHVSCPVCDYEWCWNCGREWEPGHGSRCVNGWSPMPPRVLQKEKRNLIDEVFNCLFLFFEVFVFALATAVGVVFIWPFAMPKEFFARLKNRIKNPVASRGLSVFLSIITWPAAVLLYPIKAVIEEYGVSFRRRKRWTKGTSARFGFKGMSKNPEGAQEADVAVEDLEASRRPNENANVDRSAEENKNKSSVVNELNILVVKKGESEFQELHPKS